MTSYCTVDDIRHRLTEAGYNWVADRDGDGAVGGEEESNVITTGITFADAQIGAAFSGRYVVGSGTTSSLLKFIAIDVAACRAAESGGRGVPESLRMACEKAMRDLDDIKDGVISIPEATPEIGVDGQFQGSGARAVNP